MKKKVSKKYNYYDRWEFTIPLKRWLYVANPHRTLSINDLKEELSQITKALITNIVYEKESRCYIAKTVYNNTYNFVLECVGTVASIVFLYNNHIEVFSNNTNFKDFWEMYYYHSEKFFFNHFKLTPQTYAITCTMLNCNLEIELIVSQNLPIYKICNYCSNLLKEFSIFSEDDFTKSESNLEILFKILKLLMFFKTPTIEKIIVSCPNEKEESISYNFTKKIFYMKSLAYGNYVIIRNGKCYFENSLMNTEFIYYKNCTIFDISDNEVDIDTETACKIISSIQKATEMYEQLRKDLMV